MAERIKFNVLIPTRERADTLYHCLRTVVAQDYDNLNIIVSDNFSQDKTKEVVASFDDPRIRYINTGKRVSMSHNWEYALSHVTDGWVTFLGDDDGMLPGGLTRIASVINKTGASAVTSTWKFYFWPRSTGIENQLSIPLIRGYEIRNGTVWLAKLLKGEANYFDLPWVYTGGFVDIELINNAKNENGDFFCSMTPDVYSAVALASIVNQYVMLFEPVCVMGVSLHSGGASNFGSGDNLEPAEKFHSEPNIPFHVKLCSGWIKSIQIIIYECYLQAEHVHKDVLHIDMLNQLELAVSKASLDYQEELWQYCAEVAKKNGISLNRVKVEEGRVRQQMESMWRRFSAAFQDIFLTVDASQYGVEDIYGATLLSKELYQANSIYGFWSLSRYVKGIKRIVGFMFRKIVFIVNKEA